jgi:disulfide bond formation protein DsbB
MFATSTKVALAGLSANVWGTLSIVAQVVSTILILCLIFPKLRNIFSGPYNFVAKHALPVSFVVALCGTLGSLIYSDIIGYAPCKFCWFQRIFMYPQVLLLGFAIWRKEKMMKFYGVVLSVIGAGIAFYHYLGQLGVATLPCPAVGYSVSCSKVFTLVFGYITIPLMAFSAFALITVALLVSMKEDKNVKS